MAAAIPTILRCATENWRLQNTARTGGQSLSGQQQFVASPSGQWRAKLSFHLLEDDDYLEARGFLASLDGQVTPFLIGPYDWRGRPWNIEPLTGAKITPNFQAQDIAADPAFETNPDTAGYLAFSLAANAAMNATTIQVNRGRGGRLRRGQYLGIGDRMHMIILPPVDDGTAGTVTITVRPWLRADYTAGTPVSFDSPWCLMRLADPDAGQIDMTTSPLSDVSLDLVEAFA
jgi:hypothetical protein